jgi:hypothetical protein
VCTPEVITRIWFWSVKGTPPSVFSRKLITPFKYVATFEVMGHKNKMCVSGLYIRLAQDRVLVAGSCVLGHEPSCSVKGNDHVNQLGNC